MKFTKYAVVIREVTVREKVVHIGVLDDKVSYYQRYKETREFLGIE